MFCHSSGEFQISPKAAVLLKPPPQEPCFVLELVKQEAGKPLSMHFT